MIGWLLCLGGYHDWEYTWNCKYWGRMSVRKCRRKFCDAEQHKLGKLGKERWVEIPW